MILAGGNAQKIQGLVVFMMAFVVAVTRSRGKAFQVLEFSGEGGLSLIGSLANGCY